MAKTELDEIKTDTDKKDDQNKRMETFNINMWPHIFSCLMWLKCRLGKNYLRHFESLGAT